MHLLLCIVKMDLFNTFFQLNQFIIFLTYFENYLLNTHFLLNILCLNVVLLSVF